MINVYKLLVERSDTYYRYIIHDDAEDLSGICDSIPAAFYEISNSDINGNKKLDDIIHRYDLYMKFNNTNELRDYFIEEFI